MKLQSNNRSDIEMDPLLRKIKLRQLQVQVQILLKKFLENKY